MDQTRVLSHLRMTPEFDPTPLVIVEGEQVSAAFEKSLHMGRIAIAAEAVGAARQCLARTVEYTKERVQFGRKIASFQAVKHQLADVMVSVEAAVSAVYYAALRRQRRCPMSSHEWQRSPRSRPARRSTTLQAA